MLVRDPKKAELVNWNLNNLWLLGRGSKQFNPVFVFVQMPKEYSIVDLQIILPVRHPQIERINPSGENVPKNNTPLLMERKKKSFKLSYSVHEDLLETLHSYFLWQSLSKVIGFFCKSRFSVHVSILPCFKNYINAPFII